MRIKFVKPLVDTVAHKDGMVTLCCELCKAKADVQWKKDGVEIIPSRRFSIRANGTERSLTIHRLTKEDAGEYACESKDDCTSARLRVECKCETSYSFEDTKTHTHLVNTIHLLCICSAPCGGIPHRASQYHSHGG